MSFEGFEGKLKIDPNDFPENLFILNDIEAVIEAFKFNSGNDLKDRELKAAYENFIKWGTGVRTALEKIKKAAKEKFDELKKLVKKATENANDKDLEPLKEKIRTVLEEMQKNLKSALKTKNTRAESILSHAKYRGNLQDDVETIAELMSRMNYLHVDTQLTNELIDVMNLIRAVIFKLKSDSVALEYIGDKVKECNKSQDFSDLLGALDRMNTDSMSSKKAATTIQAAVRAKNAKNDVKQASTATTKPAKNANNVKPNKIVGLGNRPVQVGPQGNQRAEDLVTNLINFKL